MKNTNENKVLTGKIIPVFFTYTLPAILGLLAISSAGIIDGMFIGNFIGETALAAVTLCNPIYSIIFGVVILLSTGGEVFCGKFIGKEDYNTASNIFSQIISIIFFISLVIVLTGLLFLKPLVELLGADAKTYSLMIKYTRIVILATPLLATYSLSYFIRVDGKPKLSSTALIITSIINIILDYIFIVQLNYGIKGAAWGTVLSYSIIPILLLPHFLLKKGKIIFKKPIYSTKIITKIIYNGSSEFLSEISGGILFFFINITMLKYYGNQGVAAYAVVGYLLFFTIMIYYGLSDALKTLLSINFGAKHLKRVVKFIKIAVITVVIFGIILIIIIQTNSKSFVQLFIKNTSNQVNILSNSFVLKISPILPIIGINIIFSAYFTATHNPKPSLIISIARSLILPMCLIPIITYFVGGKGVITAIITTEITTLIIAIFLLQKNKIST